MMADTPLRISIIAHALRAGGGISVGKNIIASLTRALPGAQFQIFIPADLGYEHSAGKMIDCRWEIYRHDRGLLGRWLYDRYDMLPRITRYQPHWVICLGNRGLDRHIGRQLLLIQDAHFFYPEHHYSRETTFNKLLLRYKRFRLANDLKRTDVLLCQTQTAIQRLRATYGFDGTMLIVPNAVSHEVHNEADESSNKSYRALPDTDTHIASRPFRLFYLTRYYPHKNLEILLDLFSKNHSALDNTVLYITIAEQQHPGAARLLQHIEFLGLTQRIINLGPIEQHQLQGYYRQMDALVMPTTLESFSGTYLEAMNFGCPIITSDLDFAREICGDAALYFDPWSVDSLRNTLIKLKSSQEVRNDLIDRGYQRSKHKNPSWDQNAAQIVTLIREQGNH